MFFLRLRKKIAPVAAGLLFAALPAFARASAKSDEPNRSRATTEDKREESLSKAKAQVFALLRDENACSAWFRESDRDPAGVFQSLRFRIEEEKPGYVLRLSNSWGGDRYKHPWAARSWQYSGRNSAVLLNAEGPFFNPSSPVVELTAGGGVARYLGFRNLTVGPFQGNTPEAQITILLHELGHITDRIPSDQDSWDGKSSRNTEEVLSHCKSEIHEFAKRNAGDHD